MNKGTVCICLFDVSLLGFQYVTCGSAIKLANSENNVRLHSHDVKYGSGSGQQVGDVCMLHVSSVISHSFAIECDRG